MSDSRARLYDLAVRVGFPILLCVVTGAVTLLWSHEGRLTVLEVRGETMLSDVQEIKSDVKKLLRDSR